ncbi:phenylalanine--tRNA ligase subunit beta [Mangrovactinospora gilvigrisea]|uniref:Phenylalanine--tRNA ligase beta subunit n=1 Tax=Mangrovactinospora gilvigrisea TaxID=1428644 RepID=A0A1J7BH14_9ACTN|nr:phenylalanine--tRNA ligase subunit beta [Mangrovactinospora gilvigrisea]OIV37950.1 phenylalanine--tRNA ligase subunit beta [Mangrovactinospora gilvigrisea]
MRVPLSWLREYVDLPEAENGRGVAARLIDAGFEVEAVEQLGADIKGPLVVGQVLAIEELEGFKKPIRYCQVNVGSANGSGEPQNIVCGARNFAVGDKVVVILPGGVLPGNFEIAARKTYGKVSEGMICSARELGLGDDHDGIIVLPPEYEPGTDAVELLQMVDEILDIDVTPDRGYCMSLRGLAREVATAYGLPLRDPALLDVTPPNGAGPQVRISDAVQADGCDLFVARAVVGLDPAARTPIWMQRRIQKAGMRPVSLIVDVANYVMLEIGQPLHTYDRGRVSGAIGVRRAEPDEVVTTLDGAKRKLVGGRDLVITDDSGPIGLAGVMGGGSTEIGPESTDVVIEAAHFDPPSISRTARRLKLPSEAAKRFERGTDPAAAAAAAQRAVDLLQLLGGETALVEAGVTEVGGVRPLAPITMPADHPDRVAGVTYGRETVVRRLQEVGCAVSGSDVLTVVPPSWRPDLVEVNDLAEEVLRLEGYDRIPSTMPHLPPGTGLTAGQRARRRTGRALAGAGFVEAPSFPFLDASVFDALGLDADDERRRTVDLVNPLNADEASMRTTLLPGLLAALRRNVGRGTHDVALFENGLVFVRREGQAPAAPRLAVDRRPTDEELASLEAALPAQPRHVAVVLAGQFGPAGWWGEGREASWADAVQAARVVADAVGVELVPRQASYAPWHPGRCAELRLGGPDGRVVGHAGELHPRVVKALELPERTSAMELDFDALVRAAEASDAVQAGRISSYPVATQDVALVVDAAVPAGEVEAALRDGAGELLESLRLFDVFEGEQIGAGKKSLAYALRFRAPDRTLTADDASAARDAAVAAASTRVGAVLRG